MTDFPFPETLDQGRYHIDKVLGEGATSVVLLALDTRMGVHRAIKLLHPRVAASSKSRARFKTEAHAQASLKHPNVLMVHDIVEDEQGVYLVMELAEADSLGKRAEGSGPMPEREVANVGILVGEALAVAHAAGLVHRDIKPANILVDRHGVVKLADFGIVMERTLGRGLTLDGVAMGTWAYMPPEQRESSRDVDARADIYALGVTLFALLTMRETPDLHNKEVWAEAFKGIDPVLTAIIQRAARLYPEDRYQRIEEMVADLKVFMARGGTAAPLDSRVKPDEAPPPSPTIIAPDEAPESVEIAKAAKAGDAAGAVKATKAVKTAEVAPMRPPLWIRILVAICFAGLGLFLAWPSEEPVSDPPAPVPPVLEPSVVPPVAEAPVAEPPASEVPPPTFHEVVPQPPRNGDPPATAPEPAARRIIAVLPGVDPAANPTATGDASVTPTATAATGTVVLRTVPSGATVQVKGRPLTQGAGGGYTLPTGSHTLDVRSAAGEQTRIAVSVKTGQTVEICYNFDTNSSCRGAP